jgi:hypothetical protein
MPGCSPAAFYDDFSRSTSYKGSVAPVKIGKDGTVGDAATFIVPELSAMRTAYDAKAGWAAEGKAWLVVKAKVSDDGPVHRGKGETGEIYGDLRHRG